MRIAFLGNFTVPFTTENHHKKAWERLGHTVIPLQENKVPPQQIVAACRDADLFQWTHTHGWGCLGTISYDQMIERLQAMGVPSFGYHLDVYWGLNILDHREDNVGLHPSWKVDKFFSTDGGHPEFWPTRGVNHEWLPPGVDEDGCYYGQAYSQYAVDVGFVGSINYHPEYPFRQRLIEALRNHYGPRFRVFQGVREQSLNNVYASVKVIVGDHCFAGCANYWSDRVPETLGRGGFMIYPRTEGLDLPLATYNPQDIGDLIRKIEYYLKCDDERERLRKDGHEAVKAAHTYRHRLAHITSVMCPQVAAVNA